MNKSEFVSYISDKHQCTKIEAEKVVDIFTKSVMHALSEGKSVSLIGFGNFSTSRVEARDGRNPKTGATIQISARTQPKFKPGQKMKDACNC